MISERSPELAVHDPDPVFPGRVAVVRYNPRRTERWQEREPAPSRCCGGFVRRVTMMYPRSLSRGRVERVPARVTAGVGESHDRLPALELPLPTGTAEHHLQPTRCQRFCQRTTDLSEPMPADEHTRRSRRSGY